MVNFLLENMYFESFLDQNFRFLMDSASSTTSPMTPSDAWTTRDSGRMDRDKEKGPPTSGTGPPTPASTPTAWSTDRAS